MIRPVLTLLVFLALSAWAGAQGPALGPTASDRINMFRANRMLLENLVRHGLEIADADSPLKRAAACRSAAQALASEVDQAARRQNPGRVAELCGHLDTLLREALAPNLETATRTAVRGSPQEAEVKKLREKVLADFDSLRAAIPADGAVAADEQVKGALGRFESLRDRLK